MIASRNPFRVSRTEELLFFRPEWCGLTWEELEANWESVGRQGAIIGPHGVGKTTLLESWQKRLEEKGERVAKVFLNRQERSFSKVVFSEIEKATVLLVDGAEQLTWARRRALVRAACGKAWLETRHRKGRLPIVANLQPDREILNRCLAELQEEVSSEKLDAWWTSHQGNLRDILLSCYDWKAKDSE